MRIYEVVEPQKRSAAAVTAELLFDHCQPFLTAIQHDISRHILWHGRRDYIENTTEISTPSGRPPKDTDEIIHSMANEWFTANFGIPYRSDALFATGEMGVAREYGRPNMIFPKGEFIFCYSNNIKDLTRASQEMLDSTGVAYESWWERSQTNGEDLDTSQAQQLRKSVFTMLTRGRYSSKGLINAINSGSEIMIHSPEGFYISPNYIDNGVDGDPRPEIFIYAIAEELRKLS